MPQLPSKGIPEATLHKVELLAKDMLTKHKLYLERKRYNLSVWRALLQQSGLSIPGVPLPIEMRLGLANLLTPKAELLEEYRLARWKAIEHMPEKQLIALCRKLRLKLNGKPFPSDFEKKRHLI